MKVNSKLQERSIGKKLADERKRMDLTIEKVAHDTRIRKEFLIAIEEDDFSKINSHVYAKGFIKNYADYLDIDSKSLIAIYKRDYENMQMKRVVMKDKEFENNKESKPKFFENYNLTGKQLTYLSIGIFLILMFVVIAQIINNTFSAPYLKLNAPINAEGSKEQSIEYKDRTIIIKGETESNTTIKINDEPLTLKNGFVFESEPIPVLDETNVILIQAENRLGRKSTIKLTINKPVDGSSSTTIAGIDSIIQIENDSTFLLVRADGIIKFNDQLFPNDAFTVQAKNTLEIESSSPENIVVFIGEKEYRLTKSSEVFEYRDGEVMHSE